YMLWTGWLRGTISSVDQAATEFRLHAPTPAWEARASGLPSFCRLLAQAGFPLFAGCSRKRASLFCRLLAQAALPVLVGCSRKRASLFVCLLLQGLEFPQEVFDRDAAVLLGQGILGRDPHRTGGRRPALGQIAQAQVAVSLDVRELTQLVRHPLGPLLHIGIARGHLGDRGRSLGLRRRGRVLGHLGGPGRRGL